MGTERFHQIRERQRTSIARPQQLADAFERRDPLQFFGSVARRITERAAFDDAIEQTLFVETVHGRHDRRISLMDFAIGKQFANRGIAARPELLQHLLLERTKLRPGTGPEDGEGFRHFPVNLFEENTTLWASKTEGLGLERRQYFACRYRTAPAGRISSTSILVG